jgi:hypothetical protein
MMFLTSENYAQQIYQLIKDSSTICVAVAFWGSQSEQMFFPPAGKKVRIICNLSMGGTNPDPIANLRKAGPEAIKQMNKLHAKVIVGERTAIVGSANFSTNGLNFEGQEADGWEEAGSLITDQGHVDSIKKWFENIWTQSETITDEDLASAKKRWNDRRQGRVQTGAGRPLMECPLAALKDRPIYLAIWRAPVSTNSEPAFDDLKQRLRLADNFNYFDQWDNLPSESFLIDVYYGRRGRILVGYSWRRVPEIDQSYVDTIGNEQMIQVAVRTRDVCEMSFSSPDKDWIKQLLKSQIEKLWSRSGDDEGGVIVPLYDALTL